MKRLVVIIFLLVDQISKYLVFSSPSNFPYFWPAQNTGIAFGLPVNQMTVILLSIAVAFFCIFLYMKRQNIFLALFLAGLLGNLIDRVVFGYVRDFITLGDIAPWFPVFNIADIMLCVGILYFFLPAQRPRRGLGIGKK